MKTILRSQKGLDPARPISTCPRCGSSCLRQRKTCTEGRFICVKCSWLGNVPATRLRKQRNITKKEGAPKEKFRSKPMMEDLVKYQDIILNLLSGLSIQEQFQKFDLFETKKSRLAESGRKNGARNKILRVYNAYSEYIGIPCEDPDFVKIRFTEDVLQLLISGIEDEETKIRDSPRLSVTFSK